MQRVEKERKEFLEKVDEIRITKHACESWEKISSEWFQEVSHNPEKEIIEMLKNAKEVKHRKSSFKEREAIIYGRPGRHFKFNEIMLVTDLNFSVVITLFPIFYPASWRPRHGRKKRSQRK